ncbi:MAG TPA: M23 family metallopeptidase [bacterium]|nr:M23 family metallopeptidase [bacterium]
MLEERFRVMYLAKDGTGIKQISLSWRQFLLISMCGVALLIGIATGAVGLFTRLYHNYRIVSLENDRGKLQKELLTIKERLAYLNERIALVEHSSDELRKSVNLPPIDSDTRQVGVGGSAYSASLDIRYITDEVSRTSAELKIDLDRFERELLYEQSILRDVSAKIIEDKNRIRHFPSIRPILGGVINSRFGMRIDPFTDKLTDHRGIDMMACTGTKILATADGVVKVVRNSYRPDQSFGKYVVIDHGYGYETLYAHCSEILVRKGQKIKRWDPIAEVGTTGRAEGPHLHYEVRLNGRQINPEYYILN